MLKKFRLHQTQRQETKKLRDYALEMSQYYKTPHLIMMVGSKTNFEDAETYYHQLDQIIERFNKLHQDVQLLHSTLSFVDEVIQYHDIEHEANYFDMMPLTDKHQNWFTGLYSSRENLKGLIKHAGESLSANNKLFSSMILHGETKMDRVN